MALTAADRKARRLEKLRQTQREVKSVETLCARLVGDLTDIEAKRDEIEAIRYNMQTTVQALLDYGLSITAIARMTDVDSKEIADIQKLSARLQSVSEASKLVPEPSSGSVWS